MSEDIKKEFTEYQLMVEEVLGGMDIILSKLERRITSLEQRCTENPQATNEFKLIELQRQLDDLNEKLTCGFELAFAKINEH